MLEGSAPEFRLSSKFTSTIMGGTTVPFPIFSTDVRTFDSHALIKKISKEWEDYKLAEFHYVEDAVSMKRAKMEIIAAVSDDQQEGAKAILWLKLPGNANSDLYNS